MTHITSKRKDSSRRNANAKPDNIRPIMAIDFDGTLAKEIKPFDYKVAGPPIPRTIKLVKKWIKDKEKIVIFTSRVSRIHSDIRIRYTRKLINAWCKQHIGTTFPITSDKNPKYIYWDNNAHRIETDTGRILAEKE